MLCDAATRLLTVADDELSPAWRVLTVANRLLTVADESIKLMQRALTPAAYSAVRPNLGMVRGTSSVVLRKTLLTRPIHSWFTLSKLQIMEFSSALADDDSAVEARARQVRRTGVGALPEILRQLVVLHQHVRVWRDNHIQLPKTHLGESQRPIRRLFRFLDPTAVCESRTSCAARMGDDSIVPLYRALLGTAPPPVHELLSPGEFDAYMARMTANAVFDVYSDVQERFYRRCPMQFSKP